MYISLSIGTKFVSLNDISIKRPATRLPVNMIYMYGKKNRHNFTGTFYTHPKHDKTNTIVQIYTQQLYLVHKHDK